MADVSIEILFFAKAREVLNRSEDTIQLKANSTPTEVLSQLESKFPALKVLERTFVLALNEEYLCMDDGQPLELHSRDQLAVIPPISGG